MSEAMERAHETMHGHGGHEAHGTVAPWARLVAVLVSMLAAALALIQIGEKQAHTEYLTHHIERSNGWAFYQAKNARAVTRESEAALLASLPNADHTLRIVEGDANPSVDYANPDLEFSPEAVAQIDAFLEEHGLAS